MASPEVLDSLCSDHILTMTYLRGPKLEEEARRLLIAQGVDIKVRASRPAPLVRVKVKFTFKPPYAVAEDSSHSAV